MADLPSFGASLWKHYVAVLSGAVSLVLAISSALYRWQQGKDPGSIWAWFLVSAAACIFRASYLAWKDERQAREVVTIQLAAIESARPTLACCGQKWVSLFAGGTYVFDVLQVWIENRPDARTIHSAASNVSVRLEFHPETASANPVVKFGSQWVTAVDPDVVTFDGHFPEIDIPANDNPAKFLLLLRDAGEDDCYAHSFGKLIGTPNGRFVPFRLRPGRYRIVITLRGDNVDQQLTHDLLIPPASGQPRLAGVPDHSTHPAPSPAADDTSG